VSLKAYTARRRLNKLRRDACRLFTSEKMVKAIKKLEVEIETQRLLVRRDRHLWKDVGERQKVLNWLLSYNPLWLRIGLETVYGELISLESNSDVMGLAIFILNRLLWNPDIAAEYRHPTVPHLYREGHEEVLSKFTLKKMLLLVCFLDCAKQSRLIDHDPCLFCKDAEFKTSKDILLAISRDFLSGEGDLSRHLGFLGLPVSHIQTPLDEFDFAVTNLAVDLQCGIRLVRAMELLTKDWNLSKQLRVPAISRLQKMHNVDIVLNVLKERGIHLKDESGASIDCRDIVDRHRERTLALLWKIVFAFQVDVFLNVEQLKEEIMFLRNAHKIKTQLGTLKLFSNCCRIQDDNSHSSSPQNYSKNVKLLMAWVNAVCGFYDIKVENFTVCFSDGRVLCHLIHHYHPCYVPLEAVCQRTTQTVECSRTHMVGLNLSSSSSESDTSLNVTEGTFDQTVTASVMYKELLDNEKKNFQLINTAVSDLGGIPAMIHHSDMSNTIPDEKVVITYLSFLCSRLLDLRQETRAARLIQSTWRKYRLKKELKLSQERDRAARIIQKHAINFLSHRRVLRKNNAAVFIQNHWRRYLARVKFLNLKKTKLEETRSKSATSTLVIQRYFRAYYMKKQQRALYLKTKAAALVLQSAYRGMTARKQLRKQRKAATTIQTAFRSYLVKKDYVTLRSAAIVVQRHYRAVIHAKWQKQKYLSLKTAVVKMQAIYRGVKVRRQIHSIIIQRRYRAFCLGKVQCKKYSELKKSAVILQAACRGMKVRRDLKTMHQSAAMIQAYYRMHKQQRDFRNFAVLRLQAAFRGMKTRRLVRTMNESAELIQRRFRTFLKRKHFISLRTAAIVIQRKYRATKLAKIQRQKYLSFLNAAVIIQSAYRGFVVRQKMQQMHQAAAVIQALWRGYSWRKRNDTAKTRALRRSLEKANENSKEENKLCNRTAIAIEYLLKYKHLSYILAALKHLEVVTRLSPLCCENMVQSRAIFTIFVLIRSCNRSVPCMDVIRYSIQVLLNVSKYERTTQAVYEVENSIDTLLDLLQMYRGKAGDKISEKGGSIFTKTCCLLAILSKDSKRALVRLSVLAVACIQSLYKLTARKCKMDAERTLVKQKTNPLISGTSFIPVTPLRTKTVSRIKPDWVLRKDNMQEIVDPLQAILMVMDTLGIACY
uniref:Assembly factor for spindle microtubules n=1 Tax=Anser brachyrhynchus TaxID=132585 RepID=A0A8B9C8X4_9AVES